MREIITSYSSSEVTNKSKDLCTLGSRSRKKRFSSQVGKTKSRHVKGKQL